MGIGNSPSGAAKRVSDEVERWAGVIRAAGIKPQ